MQSPRAFRFGRTSALPLVRALRRGGSPAVGDGRSCRKKKAPSPRMAEMGLCSDACSCDIPCVWGKRGRFRDCCPLPSGILCVQEDLMRLAFPPNPEAVSLVYGKNFLAMSASTGGGGVPCVWEKP